MNETPQGPAAAPEAEAPTPANVASDRTLAALREDVKELAGAVRGLLTRPAGTSPPAGEDGGVGAEVRAELDKLQAAEKRKAAAEGRSNQVAELAAQVKKLTELTERKPREYRPITKFMWGDGDDE